MFAVKRSSEKKTLTRKGRRRRLHARAFPSRAFAPLSPALGLSSEQLRSPVWAENKP